MWQLCHHIIIWRTETGLQNQCALPGFTLSSLARDHFVAAARTGVSSGD